MNPNSEGRFKRTLYRGCLFLNSLKYSVKTAWRSLIVVRLNNSTLSFPQINLIQPRHDSWLF